MTNDRSNWNELDEANNTESSSTLNSTVSVDSNSESEHESELQPQSDSVFHETTSKEIEVVPTKSGERKRIRCKLACNENSDEVKVFHTEVEFLPYAHQQKQRPVVEQKQSISEVKLIKRPLS